MGTRHLSSWPPNLPLELAPAAKTLWSNLAASAARVPDRTAIVYYGRELTYRELERACERLAGFLQHECGVSRGDRVALYMQNSPQFVIAFYAILRADAVVVPVNPMNLTDEVRYMVEDSGARVVIGGQEIASNAAALLGGSLRHLVVATYSDYLAAAPGMPVPDVVRAPRTALDAPGVTAWVDAMARGFEPRAPAAGPDDLCVLPYTSGTTGHPKGCMHTHRTVMHTTVAGPTWHSGVPDTEVELAVLPFFHVTGMQYGMNCPIFSGSTMVIMTRWDRSAAAELVRRFHVTSWTAVPTMIVDLLSSADSASYDLSSLRRIGGGGAAMPEAIARKLSDSYGLTYIEGYGLSETIAPTHINPPHRPKAQCLGIPIFGTDSRVVDPQTLKELPPGQVGEIVTSGPQVFSGYWNRPEANADSFVTIDGKRFFRTGDLARVDEEGYFFLVDRLKRMINVAGFKVWPAEVESMLYAHPAILEATVIRSIEDRRGEGVKAVVVLKKEARDALEEDALIAWCKTRMAAYKVPRKVAFVDALPKTASGKILWRALQEQEERRFS